MATVPTVSVIIAVRNGAETLQPALDSILEQTHPGVQTIVMDGASTDGTVDILERNADRLAYWESTPDRGIYHAWNKALDHASGDWICFLGADDRFHAPTVLKELVVAIQGRTMSRSQVVYGQVRVDEPDSTQRVVGNPWNAIRNDFLVRMAIPHQATMHHRSLFENGARFDEEYRICGDYEFLLRSVLANEPMFVPVVVTDMAVGGLSSDPANALTMTREFQRARYRHGLTRVPEWASLSVHRAAIRAWIGQVFGHRTADAVAGAYRFLIRRSP